MVRGLIIADLARLQTPPVVGIAFSLIIIRANKGAKHPRIPDIEHVPSLCFSDPPNNDAQVGSRVSAVITVVDNVARHSLSETGMKLPPSANNV